MVYANNKTNDDKSNVIVGANQISKYENLLQDKRIGIVANHTSVIFRKDIGHTHLVDSLIKLDFDVRKIFAPEHGFRGTEPNGANIDDEIDIKTGLKITAGGWWDSGGARGTPGARTIHNSCHSIASKGPNLLGQQSS